MHRHFPIVALVLVVASLSPAKNTGATSVVGMDSTSNNSASGDAAPATSDSTAVEAPPKEILVVRLSSVPVPYRAQLKEMTEEYDSRRTKALIFGGLGTTLLTVGEALYLWNTRNSTATDNGSPPGLPNSMALESSSNPGLAYLGGAMVYASIPFEIVGIIHAIHAIVKGNRLNSYEEQIGYQLAVVPFVQPKTGQTGVLASLRF